MTRLQFCYYHICSATDDECPSSCALTSVINSEPFRAPVGPASVCPRPALTAVCVRVRVSAPQVPASAKHTNNWSLDGVAGLPADGKLDLTKLGLGETSMRVRTGRNLKAFPLPGGMTKQDRCDMENVMYGAFKDLIADPAYGGRYVSLTPGHACNISDDECVARPNSQHSHWMLLECWR